MSNVHAQMNSSRRVALVTGATGFIGSHLVQKLVQDGWQVHIVTRKDSLLPDSPEFSHVFNHAHDGTTEGMIRLVGDVKPTVAFHLASLFLSQHQPKDVEQLILSNILFGCQLLEALRINGVKCIINTGTSWQHYENQNYNPVNLYAATKQAFEALMRYYIEAGDLKVITLMLFDTCGSNDTRPKLMNLLKRVAEQNQPLDMSPGEQYVDIVHVGDVVRAYAMAAERLLTKNVIGHEHYAVSSGKPIQLRELVKLVEHEIGKKLPINWGGRVYRDREVMVPWKGDSLPGWTTQIDITQAIRSIFAVQNSSSVQ